jgi:DNA-binding LacI/PurR family transcriptional regulator
MIRVAARHSALESAILGKIIGGAALVSKAKSSEKRSEATQAAKPGPVRSLSMRTQMADVAAKAGVSVATVSRALSDSSLLNEQTKQRVREVAAALNYSINIAAKNFRLKQNRTIAVVLPFDFRTAQSASDPFFISLLGSIADAITARGCEMLLSRVNAEQLHSVAELVHSGRAVGIIVIGQWHQHATLDALGAQNIPLVVWGANMPRQRYYTVGSNNVLGGRLAADHLLQLGRKHIAFFGDTKLPEVAQRFQGFKLALQKAGHAVESGLCVPAPFVAESGKHAVLHLLQQGHRFDAIFACSDLLAMTAIQALLQQGRSVPQDVAVVGYDDVPIASFFAPSISTVSQHVEAAGEALVRALLEPAEASSARFQLLTTELIARDSSSAFYSKAKRAHGKK